MVHGCGGARQGAGRPAGSRNKRTLEAQAVAKAIIEHPAVQARWLEQAIAGELSPTIVQLLCYYAWGKPVERVEHAGDADQPLTLVLRRGIEDHTRQANERLMRLRQQDRESA